MLAELPVPGGSTIVPCADRISGTRPGGHRRCVTGQIEPRKIPDKLRIFAPDVAQVAVDYQPPSTPAAAVIRTPSWLVAKALAGLLRPQRPRLAAPFLLPPRAV